MVIERGVRLNLSRRRSAFLFPDEFHLRGKTFWLIFGFMIRRPDEEGVLIQAPHFLFLKTDQMCREREICLYLSVCLSVSLFICLSVCLTLFLQTAKRPRWQQGSLIETTLIIIFMFEIRSALISLKLDTHTHSSQQKY